MLPLTLGKVQRSSGQGSRGFDLWVCSLLHMMWAPAGGGSSGCGAGGWQQKSQPGSSWLAASLRIRDPAHTTYAPARDCKGSAVVFWPLTCNGK